MDFDKIILSHSELKVGFIKRTFYNVENYIKSSQGLGKDSSYIGEVKRTDWKF